MVNKWLRYKRLKIKPNYTKKYITNKIMNYIQGVKYRIEIHKR